MPTPTALEPARTDASACRDCETDATWLDNAQELATRMAEQAALPAPKVRVVPGHHFTACVRDYDTAAPLLMFDEKARHLTGEQLAGVVAHELGHIAHHRPRYRILSNVPWTGAMLGTSVFCSALLAGTGQQQLTSTLPVAAAGLLVVMVAVLAQAVLYARHRRYELVADAFARELGYGQHLVRFLAGAPGRRSGAVTVDDAIRQARAVRLPVGVRAVDLLGRTHPRHHVRIVRLAGVGSTSPFSRDESAHSRTSGEALSDGAVEAR